MKYTIYNQENQLKLDTSESSDEVIEIRYSVSTTTHRGMPITITRRQMLDDFRDHVTQIQVSWINPGYQQWLFDLGHLPKSYPELKSEAWLVENDRH